jgi:hypothetical protein
MKSNHFFSGAFCVLALLLFMTSCKKEVKNPSSQDELSTGSARASNAKALETDLLKSVRNATARFHSTTQAINAGYEPSDHCVSAPNLGGMGYHWVNPTLVDPVFDPLKPEALLYARGPGGNLRLIAVEYIVIDVGQPRPMFGDQPFDSNGTPIPAPHWSLHVWLYEHNPSGIFAPFNPNVSCQ